MLFSSIVRFILLFSAFIILIYINSIYALDDIDVPIKIGDNELVLSFPPTKDAAAQMANQFCRERAPVDPDDPSLMQECTRTMTAYLQSQVAEQKVSHKSKQKKTDTNQGKDSGSGSIKITLDVSGSTFDVEYFYREESAYQRAAIFCQEYMQVFGINESNMEEYCIIPVKQRLEEVYKDSLEKAKSDL